MQPIAPVLRVVPPAQYEQQLQAEYEANARAALGGDEAVTDSLAGYIRGQFDMMQKHRSSEGGWNDRLLGALRTFNGQYDASKLSEIRKFGGSEVYARVIAMKCRGASSLLRDVYLSSTRPWGLDPPADPDIPQSISDSIRQLVAAEVSQLMMQQQAGPMIDPMGQPAIPPPVDEGAIRDRMLQLLSAARDAARRRAAKQAQIGEDRMDEILQNGGFYKAMSEFLTDLPMFPFAVLKGPIVRIVPKVKWENGAAVTTQEPAMFWQRVSPFDIWWTPGVNDIEDAQIIERIRFTRAELNDLLDLPGYNHDAIRAVLTDYGRSGVNDDFDDTDTERADLESREDPHMNESGMLTCLEFHGNIQGQMLIEWGIPPEQVPDPVRDYAAQAWLIGRYVIKAQLSPSPRKRHPFFITSFEKVPGTPVGNGLTDILEDIQDVANATLRALVNNMSISSGPQVMLDDDRLVPSEDNDNLYPWKRWHTSNDPMGSNARPPVSFFQPNSNAVELLTVYKEFLTMADDLSAIPKYQTGGGASGGAGRTASGLSMLMQNASKILQTVAGNIDRDVLYPLLTNLYDMIMLTDTTGLLSGQEQVAVRGVDVALQKETQRQRQIEFLQATANPMDAQIMGMKGRANVLRSVATTIGINGGDVVPPEDEMERREAEMQMMQQMQQMGAQAQGGQQGLPGPGAGEPRENLQRDMGS